jgi:hypothetical protein
MSAMTLVAAQEQFASALPTIRTVARHAFRRWPDQAREEALAEVQACAWKAWRGLVARGQDPAAVGIAGIAGFAVRHTLNGRRIGNTGGGRSRMDVHHPRAQRRRGFRVVSLDAKVDPGSGPGSGSWKDWLAEDNAISPADEAIFHLDYGAWLAGLAVGKRRVAELLAEGHEPGVVARIVGVSPARVSQLRHELEASWRAFQGPTPVPEAGDLRMARV